MMDKMAVAKPFIFLVVFLITLAGDLQGQDTPITASLSLSTKAYQYGGMNVILEVQNISQQSVVIYYSEKDELLVMIGSDGKKYDSWYRSKPVIKSVEVEPKASFVHEFEVESVGIVDTLFDNGGYGPIFDPMLYDATYTLRYHVLGSEDMHDTLVASGIFYVDPVSIAVQSAVDQYRLASMNLDMYWMSQFPSTVDEISFEDALASYLSYIEECKSLHVYHRFLKAATEKLLLHFPENVQPVLEQYLLEFPDSVHVSRFVTELQILGVRDEFYNKLTRRAPKSQAVMCLTVH